MIKSQIDESYQKTKRFLSSVDWVDNRAETGLSNHLLSRRSDMTRMS